MKTTRILVTGAHGQLGQTLKALTPLDGFEFTFASHIELDITKQELISEFFDKQHFDVCINTAAYTHVDLAEQEQEKAIALNALAPGLLAKACRNHGAALIHFSSDYVYHNGLTRPLREDDPASPASVYAKSKLEGEHNAFSANPRTLIIRTSWLFSEYGHNFVKTIVRLMRSGKSLRVVNDQTGCPTYAGDLAKAVIKVVNRLKSDDDTYLFGIYNYSNSGQVTWYDFARAIEDAIGLDATITPVTTAEYGAAAVRPNYSVLDTEKIQRAFAVETPDWHAGLQKVVESMKE